MPINHSPVAVIQIGDALCQRCQSQAIRADEHLIVAEADCERCPMLRTNNQIRMAGENHRQRVGTFQSAERCTHSLNWLHVSAQMQVDQLRHRLGVGLCTEFLTLSLKFGTQL